MDGLAQDGELPPHRLHVEGDSRGPAHGSASARPAMPGRVACSCRPTARRSGSISSVRTRSLAKAQVRRLRASCLADPPRAEVEESVRVELPGGRAVLALDVVGQDLELRRRVHERLPGEQQVAVHLQGVGLLRARADDHEAAEDAPRLPVEDPLVELPARAMGLRVLDPRVGVGHAAAVDDEEAVERAVPTLRVEAHVDVVAGERGPEGERVVGEARVAPQPHGEGGDVEGGGAFLLELVAVHEGVVLDHHLGDGVRERGARRGRGEGLDEPALAPPPGHDERAGVGDRGLAVPGGEVR